jgi:hypothetical protein
MEKTTGETKTSKKPKSRNHELDPLEKGSQSTCEGNRESNPDLVK